MMMVDWVSPTVQRVVWYVLAMPALLGIAIAVLWMVRHSLMGDEVKPTLEPMTEEWARDARYRSGKQDHP